MFNDSEFLSEDMGGKEQSLLKEDNFHAIDVYMVDMLNSLYEDGEVDGVVDDDINENGRRFELFIGELFRLSGFKIEVTPFLNDGGIDVYAKKGAERYVIQAKKREPIRGGINKDDIKDLCAADIWYPEFYKAKKVLITTHFFTTDAMELAQKQNIELIDRYALFRLIAQMQPQLLARGYFKRYTEPPIGIGFCECGKPLIGALKSDAYCQCIKHKNGCYFKTKSCTNLEKEITENGKRYSWKNNKQNKKED